MGFRKMEQNRGRKYIYKKTREQEDAHTFKTCEIKFKFVEILEES